MLVAAPLIVTLFVCPPVTVVVPGAPTLSVPCPTESVVVIGAVPASMSPTEKPTSTAGRLLATASELGMVLTGGSSSELCVTVNVAAATNEDVLAGRLATLPAASPSSINCACHNP